MSAFQWCNNSSSTSQADRDVAVIPVCARWRLVGVVFTGWAWRHGGASYLAAIVLAMSVWLCGPAEAACSGSGTTWTCPAGSSMTDIGSAYSSGTDPVDITLAAGSYTWATGSITLSNSKGIYLHCATALLCDVDAGVNYMIYMDTLSGVNTKTYRFSGLDITQASTAYLAWIYSSGSPPANTVMQNFRFDHNRVTLTSGATDWVAIKTGGGGKPGRIYGVIDNNTFQGAKNFTIAHLSGSGINTTVDFHPESASLRGTVNNMFIEDNTLSFDAMTNAGLGCIDMVSAAGVVVRNNYSRNCLWTSHGVVHTGGSYNFEFYDNIVEQDAGAGAPYQNGFRSWHHQGSGEITLWRNRFILLAAYSGNLFELTHYRSGTGGEGTDPAGGEAGYDTLAQGKIYGRCAGSTTSPYAPDGNAVSPGNGYPCWMQPGRAPAASGAGSLSPVYVWDNQKPDGSLANLYVNPQWVVSVPPDATTHVVENRDWYESKTTDSSTFNGTVGVGFGAASPPGTCTTNSSESGGGVAYFETDQGAWNTESSAVHTSHTAHGTTHSQGADGLLYRCSATNTWTLHYTPYDYPHPLRSGDSDPPAAGGPIRLRRP